MSAFDDRVIHYAVEPAAKAGGLAAGVILVATILHIPRPAGVRTDVVFVGTFFAVFLGYLTWRVVRRARDGSLYRASATAFTTLDEDRSDTRRIAMVGALAGGLVVAILWVAAR
jgi:hypothetical protein